MDNKFLNKVLDQIVSETRIDYGMGEIQFSFSSLPAIPLLLFLFSSPFSSSVPLPLFTKHCEEVYGLNEQEIDYVWKEYKRIIKDKINSNG
jgi:hypothetical protein